MRLAVTASTATKSRHNVALLFNHSSQINLARLVANIFISCNDINMSARISHDDSIVLLRNLADFRFALRQFLHFSECAALEAGLHPQQHQLLLQVAGAPEGTAVTIAYAAERLGLKHNSTVELVNRSEREGLLSRIADDSDRRCAILQVTRKGNQVLGKLSSDHARELKELAPQLAEALKRVRSHVSDRKPEATR